MLEISLGQLGWLTLSESYLGLCLDTYLGYLSWVLSWKSCLGELSWNPKVENHFAERSGSIGSKNDIGNVMGQLLGG